MINKRRSGGKTWKPPGKILVVVRFANTFAGIFDVEAWL